jgi:hypothetical protein
LKELSQINQKNLDGNADDGKWLACTGAFILLCYLMGFYLSIQGTFIMQVALVFGVISLSSGTGIYVKCQKRDCS